MTREEAIEVLQQDIPCEQDTDVIESLEMAIKALAQEPCEDAISRQAVLETLDDMDNVLDEDRTIENYKELLKECYAVLPPVNPQPKTGHWIIKENGRVKCSKCLIVQPYSSIFCPSCGTKMVEPQESEG